MLAMGSKRLRVKGALLVAALYALCILAPHVALAFSDAPAAAHCLGINEENTAAHVHKAKSAAHTHGDGTVHEHHDGGAASDKQADGKEHPQSCCGLFCVSAIDNPTVPFNSVPYTATAAYATLQSSLTGSEPGLLYRPPNA
jgi:hypothetical protein